MTSDDERDTDRDIDRAGAPRSVAGVEIRDMGIGDLAAVAAMEQTLQPLTPWTAQGFHDALDRPDVYICRVATRTAAASSARGTAHTIAHPIAYAICAVAGDADIHNIAVHHDHQRLGIGAALLADLLAEAWARGAREAFLDVRADNAPARAIYAAFGFTETGRRRDYYGPGQDGVVMHRALTAPDDTGTLRRRR